MRINREIELLRGVAVLMVCIWHFPAIFTWNPPWIARMTTYVSLWSGVDLFFAISGFVVGAAALALFRHAKAPHGHSRTQLIQVFFLRRVFRILPAGLFWLGIYLLSSIVFNQAGRFGPFLDTLKAAVATVTFSANMYWHDVFWIQKLPVTTPAVVYWSLSLEEQFYLLFPLFAFVLPERFRVRTLALLIAAQFFLYRPVWSLGWSFRIDAICWGLLIALCYRQPLIRAWEPRFLANRLAARTITFALVALLALIPCLLYTLSWYLGMLALICALLVWLASFEKSYIDLGRLADRLLLWCGSRSYALYLAHSFAFNFVYEMWYRWGLANGRAMDGSMSLRLGLSAVLLLIVCAEFSFRIVEEPLRRHGRRLTGGMLEHPAHNAP